MHTHTYGRWENLEDFNMKLLYKLMHLANNIFMISASNGKFLMLTNMNIVQDMKHNSMSINP